MAKQLDLFTGEETNKVYLSRKAKQFANEQTKRRQQWLFNSVGFSRFTSAPAPEGSSRLEPVVIDTRTDEERLADMIKDEEELNARLEWDYLQNFEKH